jgi:hypothetical protein
LAGTFGTEVRGVGEECQKDRGDDQHAEHVWVPGRGPVLSTGVQQMVP